MKERRFRIYTANLIIAAVLALSISIAVVASLPESGAVTETAAIYNGNKNGKSVALMFNVYQNTPETLEIAEIFDRYGFKTTFFLGGSWASRNGDALVKLASGGFELANHGYLHRDHAKLNEKANADEIKMTEKIIETTLKDIKSENGEPYKAVRLFAPPSGSFGETMFKVCADMEYKVIMWTRDTIDWRDQDAKLIFDRAVKNLSAGDLILMHPTKKTVEALPLVLDYIISAGLIADTVSNTI